MLRTNFKKEDLEIYQLAIAEYKEKTGSDRLSIKAKGYDVYGKIVKDAMSLHDSEDIDLSKFWEIFNKIQYNSKFSKLFESDLYLLINRHLNAGLSKSDLIEKMELVLASCMVSTN